MCFLSFGKLVVHQVTATAEAYSIPIQMVNLYTGNHILLHRMYIRDKSFQTKKITALVMLNLRNSPSFTVLEYLIPLQISHVVIYSPMPFYGWFIIIIM